MIVWLGDSVPLTTAYFPVFLGSFLSAVINQSGSSEALSPYGPNGPKFAQPAPMPLGHNLNHPGSNV